MKSLKKYLSPTLLVLAAMIWGLAFSAQDAATSVPPFTLGAVRSVFATVFLIFVIISFDKISNTRRRLFSKKKIIDVNRTEIIGGTLCGAILAVASFFQQTGIAGGTEAGKAAFITSLYVVLVPVYAIFFKRRAALNVWISMPIAIVGFYLLCITENLSMVFSDVFVLICALIFPFHILVIDRFSPQCDGIRMSFIQFFVASLINAILALIFESPISFSLIGEHIMPLLFLGIGSSGIAYTLQIIGQRGANPAAASIIMSLESVFGVLGSAIFLGEEMLTREYIGCAILFVAVIISQIDISVFKESKGNGDTP